MNVTWTLRKLFPLLGSKVQDCEFSIHEKFPLAANPPSEMWELIWRDIKMIEGSSTIIFFSTLLVVQWVSAVTQSYSLRPHEMQHARPPCPSPTPRVHPNPCPLSQWGHPTISSSVVPFSFRSGLSCPSPENVPNLRIKPSSSTLQADSLPAETPEKPSFPWGKRKRLFTLFFWL